MFALNCSAITGLGSWRLAGQRFTGARGWIEPLGHAMVEARGVADGQRLGVAILERPHPGRTDPASPVLARGNAGDFLEARERTFAWPLHWFWLEIDPDTITIRSSALPTVPVFLAAAGDRVLAHWDPLRLYPHLDGRLDANAAAYYLCTFDQPYAPTTLLDGVTRLCAGHSARWDKRKWTVSKPEPIVSSHPRALKKDADPVGTFEELMTAAIRRSLGSVSHAASQLSGGLDSAIVSGTLAREGHVVSTFGIIVPGEIGRAQEVRRAIVARRFSFDDTARAIAPDYSPWSAGTGQVGTHKMVPWEELYDALFDDLHARAAAQGHTVFLTGLGGDDLLAPYWDELPDRGLEERTMLSGERELPDFFTAEVKTGLVERTAALNDTPPAFVQRGVLDAAAGAAASSLRFGLWPIHPLITPEVVRYCHAMPKEWREGRRLMRELLSRWGLPRSVSHPATSESFTDTCVAAMRRCPNFRRLLFAPRLADLGLIEPVRVAHAFQSWCAGRAPRDWDIHFVAIATLESTLESIEAARRPHEVRQASIASASALILD